MVSKLVGFKRFENKKGKTLCVANIETPFNPAENARGSYGVEVQGVFMPDDQVNLLTEQDIGKEVELYYQIVSGRAYLQSLLVKQNAGK